MKYLPPNKITPDTDTTINGVLVGDAGKVRAATSSEIVTDAELAAGLAFFRPVILQQPVSAEANVGESIELSVIAGVVPNSHLQLLHRWQFSDDDEATFNNVPGGISNVLPLSPTLPQNTGLYRCVVSNAFGSETSDSVQVIVNGSVPPAPANDSWSVGDVQATPPVPSDTSWEIVLA
jgi:hypothetical protein